MTFANSVNRFPNRPVRKPTTRSLLSADGMDFENGLIFMGRIFLFDRAAGKPSSESVGRVKRDSKVAGKPGKTRQDENKTFAFLRCPPRIQGNDRFPAQTLAVYPALSAPAVSRAGLRDFVWPGQWRLDGRGPAGGPVDLRRFG